MPLPKLTAAMIKRSATKKSFARGEGYFHSEAVVNVTLRQQTLYAEVEGSEPEPYRVTIEFDKGGVTKASCSCPYSFGGWCKHTVAAMLVCVHQPEVVEERPSLDQLLDKITLAQAKELIQTLVNEHPNLIESVDFHISTSAILQNSSEHKTQTKRKKKKRTTTVDPTPYERKVRDILNGAVRDWNYGRDDDSIGEELTDLMDEAIAFAEQDDAATALILLKAITDSCTTYWHIVEDYIGMAPIDFDIDFDSVWTEALLSAKLTADETITWQSEVEAWQDSLGSFDMTLEALHQGWDYAPLQAVLAGNITENGAWAEEPPEWGNEFTQIRLRILHQQERYEDYLLLADAEGQTQAHLTMLGQLGRLEEAIDVAQTEMTTLQEARALAKILRNEEKLSQALNIAMEGIHLYEGSPHITFEFANWTRDLAEELDNRTAALEASIVAFRAKPSLKDYQSIQELSADDWPEVQQQLLQYIRHESSWTETDAQVDILLHENLIDDAVQKVSGFNSYHDKWTLKVMKAAIATHSQWVIESAIPRAETIMDRGKSSYYDVAVEWLKRAKAAYLASGKEQLWQSYRQQMIDIHGRKRKLMGLFEQNNL